MKIISFPFAGGNSQSYNVLFKKNKRFTTLTYPGRGSRFKEHLINNVDELVNDMFEKTLQEIKSCTDYIVYGHSMGALIAYLVVQKIEQNNIIKPQRLIVSGSRPPNFPRKENIAHLPNDVFWSKVLNFGGMPDDLSDYPELISFFIPILKADFYCIENYKHQENTSKLTVPIDVFYGSEENISDEDIKCWKNHTTESVTIKKMKGNHFFIFNNSSFSEEINKYVTMFSAIS